MQHKRTKTSQRRKILLREKLPCGAGEPGKDGVTPEASLRVIPAGLPGLAEAEPPHRTISSQRTSSISAVSSSKVTKWLLSATCMADTSYRKSLQATPILRRVEGAGVKLAKQPGRACRASCDVTLSGTFNALCQHAELRMIALFAI